MENTEYNETLNIFDRITNSHTRTHTHTHTHNTHTNTYSHQLHTKVNEVQNQLCIYIGQLTSTHKYTHTQIHTYTLSLSYTHTHTHITLHLNLSLNHGGRWGITDDFPTSFSLTNTQATATHDRTSTFTHHATR